MHHSRVLMSAKQSVVYRERTRLQTVINLTFLANLVSFAKYNPVLSDFDDICDIKGVQSAAWILPKGSAYIAYYL